MDIQLSEQEIENILQAGRDPMNGTEDARSLLAFLVEDMRLVLADVSREETLAFLTIYFTVAWLELSGFPITEIIAARRKYLLGFIENLKSAAK